MKISKFLYKVLEVILLIAIPSSLVLFLLAVLQAVSEGL